MNIGNWKDKIKIARNTRFRDDDTGVVTGTGSRGEGFYNITIKGSILNDVPTLDLDSGNPMGTLEKGMSAAIGFVNGQPFLFGFSPSVSSGDEEDLSCFILPFVTRKGNIGQTRFIPGSEDNKTPLGFLQETIFEDFIEGEVPIFCNRDYFYTNKSRYFQTGTGLVKDKDWDEGFEPSIESTFLWDNFIVLRNNDTFKTWDCKREEYYEITRGTSYFRQNAADNAGYPNFNIADVTIKVTYGLDAEHLIVFLVRYNAPFTLSEETLPTVNKVNLFSINYKGEETLLESWSNVYEPMQKTGGGGSTYSLINAGNIPGNVISTSSAFPYTYGRKYYRSDYIDGLIGEKGMILMRTSQEYEHKPGFSQSLVYNDITDNKVDLDSNFIGGIGDGAIYYPIPTAYFTASGETNYSASGTDGAGTNASVMVNKTQTGGISTYTYNSNTIYGGNSENEIMTSCSGTAIINTDSGRVVKNTDHQHATVFGVPEGETDMHVLLYQYSRSTEDRQIEEYDIFYSDFNLSGFRREVEKNVSLGADYTSYTVKTFGNNNWIDIGNRDRKIIYFIDMEQRIKAFEKKKYIFSNEIDFFFEVDNFNISNNELYILHSTDMVIGQFPNYIADKKQNIIKDFVLDDEGGDLVYDLLSVLYGNTDEDGWDAFISETFFLYIIYEKNIIHDYYERGIVGFDLRTGQQVYKWMQETVYDKDSIYYDGDKIDSWDLPDHYNRLYYYGTCFGIMEFDTTKDASEWTFKIVR